MKNLNKTNSITTRGFLLSTFIVLFQTFFFMFMLTSTSFFIKLDEQLISHFDTQSESQANLFNTSFANVVQNMTLTSETISNYFINFKLENSLNTDEVLSDDLFYNHFAKIIASPLVDLLTQNSISGAFLILKNVDDEIQFDHNSIYVQNTQPQKSYKDTSDFQLLIGPSYIARQENIDVSSFWDLNITLNADTQYDFYSNPIEASQEYMYSKLERFGYWDISPASIVASNKEHLYYTLPILDDTQNAIGIIGIEIDFDYFLNYYLADNMDYESNFYALTQLSDYEMLIDKSAPNHPITKTYFQTITPIVPYKTYYNDFYTLELEQFGDMYGKIVPLKMYSDTSPFQSETWYLASFISTSELHTNSNALKTIFFQGFFVTFVITILFCLGLINISTKRIASLAKYVRELSPHHEMSFNKTHLTEIDDLTDALIKLNKKVLESSQTIERILKMTSLDIGGYEILNSADEVVLTEYIYHLLQIPPNTHISTALWNSHYEKLTENQTDGYDDTYQYIFQGEDIWLRILNSQTEDGSIGMILDITKDVQDNLKMQHQLDYDELTQLYNRNAFQRKCLQQISKKEGKIGAMFFIDLDNLKYMNDTFGHEMGDLLITTAANLFRRFEQYGGVVARNSGDEFTAFIYGFDTKDAIRNIVSRERESFSQEAILLPNNEFKKIRFSMGVSWYPDDSSDLKELLQFADFAMYEVKHSTKGGTKEFDPRSYEKGVHLLENREVIHKLIDEKLIYFVYQPIVDLTTAEIYGYEALMRSKLDEFQTPIEILTVASSQSKSHELEQLVITEVLADAYARRDEFHGKKIFINSITSQSISDAEYQELKNKYGSFLYNIVLEITEAENNTPDGMMEKISDARNYGMTLAIDDFGNGYSNETRIITIKPDIIKIDINLISDIHKNQDKRDIVYNLVSFCHARNIHVIAEGIEVYEDLEEIISLGIDFVQGFYLASPDVSFQSLTTNIKQSILFLNQKYF